MKLKNIMYSIAYGYSIKELNRKEGIRRVKLAQTKMRLRAQKKSLMFPFRYGSSSKQLVTFVEGEVDFILARDKMRDKVYTSFYVPKTRQRSVCPAFKVFYGEGDSL